MLANADTASARPGGRLRVLYLTRESHPSTRPDVQALFGKYLPAEGVQVDLVAIGDPAAQWPGGARHVLSASRRWQRPLARLRAMLALPRQIASDVDVVVARDLFWMAAWALRLARVRGCAFAYWMSLPFPLAWCELGRDQMRRARGPLAWILGLRWLVKGLVSGYVLRHWVLPRATHVFAQSELMAEFLVRQGVPADAVTPVPMGVDFEALAAEAGTVAPVSLAPGRWLVYLGALERSREPDKIIAAVALARRRMPDLNCLLVGDSQDPADRPWLQAVVAAHGLTEHVVHTGWLAPAQARAYVAAAHLALATYPRGAVHDMASPTKVSEYLALGTPVLATTHPDQDRLLAAVGGGLSVPFEAKDLALGIERMLAEPERWRAAALEAVVRVTNVRGYRALAAVAASALCRCAAAQRRREPIPASGATP